MILYQLIQFWHIRGKAYFPCGLSPGSNAGQKPGLRSRDSAINSPVVFRLTKREKQILAFVLLAFLTGWGFREWLSLRDAPGLGHSTDPNEFHKQLSGEN